MPNNAPADSLMPKPRRVLPRFLAVRLPPFRPFLPRLPGGNSASGLLLSIAFAFAFGIAHTHTNTRAESLWKPVSARSMFSDKRATAVGDILTVIVQENNSTAKDSNTKTAKKSGIDASIASFLYSPAASGLLTKKGQLPALKISGESDFSGGGSINNSERIVARIAVRVVDVLPNRHLIVEGTRQTSFSGESQDIVLRGIVRPEDVAANNTLFSYNIADASIRFVSKGTVTNSQRKGWFTRVWDKVSPF
jgi:flagellar L-ring protein precursor FlgH